MSLNWDPVKAKDNESDVIGYMVMINLSFVTLRHIKHLCKDYIFAKWEEPLVIEVFFTTINTNIVVCWIN